MIQTSAKNFVNICYYKSIMLVWVFKEWRSVSKWTGPASYHQRAGATEAHSSTQQPTCSTETAPLSARLPSPPRQPWGTSSPRWPSSSPCVSKSSDVKPRLGVRAGSLGLKASACCAITPAPSATDASCSSARPVESVSARFLRDFTEKKGGKIRFKHFVDGFNEYKKGKKGSIFFLNVGIDVLFYFLSFLFYTSLTLNALFYCAQNLKLAPACFVLWPPPPPASWSFIFKELFTSYQRLFFPQGEAFWFTSSC